jgi:hypothetical protein
MNIIELAKQAGLHLATDVNWMPIIGLEYAEKFADLIRADEREACAEVVDAAKADEADWDSNDWNQAVEFCASRIRARGNT